MVATLLQTDTLQTDLQTVEESEQWERQHITEGSYEFVRGRVVRKPAMKQHEIFIVSFLIRLFAKTQLFLRGDDLLPETDSYVDGVRKRVPDLTYFTAEQKQMVRNGERIQTLFPIEILSDPELHQDVLDKRQDYFDGGIQVVYYIVPNR